jgi:hypothetical protein
MRVSEHVASVLKTSQGAGGCIRPRAGYVVFSGPYLSNSAGVFCLHKLCDELNRRGYPSFTTGGDVAATHLNAPIIDEDSAAALCARGFIAVYPETVSGNPLRAEDIVRWVLNRPGLLGGDEVYADSELVFSYSNVYTPYIRNRLAAKLHMPTIDQSLFYCEDTDLTARSLTCYYVGKSTWKDGFCDPEHSFEITRHSPGKQELGKLFRSSKVLYCFDNSTILIYEALLCGCPVVVIPDGTQTKADLEQLELGAEGISWGLDEFAGRPVDVANLEARVSSVRQQFVSQLEQLIALSQSQVKCAIDWENEAFTTVNWRTHPRLAMAISARRIARKGRQAERSVRLWRKRQATRVREWLSVRYPSRSDTLHYYCTDWRLSNRRLECYLPHDRRTRTDEFDENETFRLSPSISASQLSKLFRASRRFYSFNPESRLVGYALACGCPVTLIGASQTTQHILPKGPGSSPKTSSVGGAQSRAAELHTRCAAADA